MPQIACPQFLFLSLPCSPCFLLPPCPTVHLSTRAPPRAWSLCPRPCLCPLTLLLHCPYPHCLACLLWSVYCFFSFSVRAQAMCVCHAWTHVCARELAPPHKAGAHTSELSCFFFSRLCPLPTSVLPGVFPHGPCDRGPTSLFVQLERPGSQGCPILYPHPCKLCAPPFPCTLVPSLHPSSDSPLPFSGLSFVPQGFPAVAAMSGLSAQRSWAPGDEQQPEGWIRRLARRPAHQTSKLRLYCTLLCLGNTKLSFPLKLSF